jgi:hypothetical protein
MEIVEGIVNTKKNDIKCNLQIIKNTPLPVNWANRVFIYNVVSAISND